MNLQANSLKHHNNLNSGHLQINACETNSLRGFGAYLPLLFVQQMCLKVNFGSFKWLDSST